jgi:hypothetical protein
MANRKLVHAIYNRAALLPCERPWLYGRVALSKHIFNYEISVRDNFKGYGSYSIARSRYTLHCSSQSH